MYKNAFRPVWFVVRRLTPRMSLRGSRAFETPALSDCFNVNGAWKPLYSCSFGSCHAQLWIPQVTTGLQVAILQFQSTNAKLLLFFLNIRYVIPKRWNDQSYHWLCNIVQKVIRWGRTCVDMIPACCDSAGLLCAQTHGWVLWVGWGGGVYNWSWLGVDTSSCLQGWNTDLTPTAVQRRHQLGLEPEKMSFTSSINTAVHSPSQPQVSFTFFLSSQVFFFYVLISLYLNLYPIFFPPPLYPLQCVPLPLSALIPPLDPSLPPNFPSLLPPPTCKSFPVTQHWFSANFSSLLEHQSLWHSSSWLLWWLHSASLGSRAVVNSSGERGLLSHKCCLLQVVPKMQQSDNDIGHL